jgi:electron transfer flavoprotein beta subunit
MQVVVLLAGVVDPKWRLTSLDEPNLPRRLSPFDKAALECALKLRDADAAVTVSAVLVGGPEGDALVRTAAAFRPQRAFRFGEAGMALWDPATAATLLAAAVHAATPKPSLVLLGREFGDGDDGVLPPALAECLGFAFCGQAHAVALAGGAVELRRNRGPREEMLRLAPPLVASITNERGNKLRHPLMKNVVLAKREPVQAVPPPVASAPPALALRGLATVPPPQRGAGACRILSGPIEAQVAELAARLRGQA